jgi:predicted RNase H-like HicB family nuclease
MKDSAKYVKIVEWSEEDQCYVGSAPGLIYGGCHGDDEKQVFDELCQIVEEAIELYRKDGKPLPGVTSPTSCTRLREAFSILRLRRPGSGRRAIRARHYPREGAVDPIGSAANRSEARPAAETED